MCQRAPHALLTWSRHGRAHTCSSKRIARSTCQGRPSASAYGPAKKSTQSPRRGGARRTSRPIVHATWFISRSPKRCSLPYLHAHEASARSRGPARHTSGSPGTRARRTRGDVRRLPRGAPPRETSPSARGRRGENAALGRAGLVRGGRRRHVPAVLRNAAWGNAENVIRLVDGLRRFHLGRQHGLGTRGRDRKPSVVAWGTSEMYLLASGERVEEATNPMTRRLRVR